MAAEISETSAPTKDSNLSPLMAEVCFEGMGIAALRLTAGRSEPKFA